MHRLIKYLTVFLFVSVGASGETSLSNPDALFDSLEKNISTGDSSIPIILNKEISLAQATGDSLISAKGCYVLGKYYMVRTFNFSIAYNYFLRALTNFERANDTRNIGKSEMQIGLIYFLQKNLTEARNHFLTAYSKMIQTNDSMRIGRIAYLLGLTFSEKKDFINASNYLRVAGKYAEASSDENARREYMYGMGIYYLNSNNADSALHYLMPVYQHELDQKYTAGIQKYGTDLAKTWWLKGNINKTKEFADDVIAKGRNVGTESAFVTCYHLLYEIALMKNDNKEAVNYLNKFILLKDSMINEQNLFDIATLKTTFLLEKELHERDIVEAKKDAEQQAILDKQKRQRNIFIASSVFSLIFLAFVIYAYSLKKKKNLQLAQTIEKLNSTQEQLVHNEKLASMGKLSAGIAHEIRNPLNFVNNFSEISGELLDELRDATDKEKRDLIFQSLKDNVHKISHHGKRAELVVNQFIDHVHASPNTRDLTDINQLCESHLKILLQSNLMNKTTIEHRLTKTYTQNLPLVSISQQEIGRVLLYILTNSFQALEEKLAVENYVPEITISTFAENNFLNVIITDNGIGIEKEIINKVLDPFFTTRPPGEGAGLGLSVAHDIVRSYGGKLIVQSDPGVVTSVKFSIPY